ncbi:MAG: V-type ATP synthase subunit F, partial [Halobacteriota archaeon]
MYKFVVVTDPETAPGFRLAGVEVLEASTVKEAKDIIPPLLYKDDTGIVAVNEDFMASLDEKLMEKIEKTHRPIII